MTRADWTPPDGPRWTRNAYAGQKQTDGRGVEWTVSRTSEGGRVIHWYTTGPYREAITEATPSHAGYPTDEELAAERRAERQGLRRARA